LKSTDFSLNLIKANVAIGKSAFKQQDL